MTYQRFILPQLSKVVSSLTKLDDKISVLEIGPGSKSVLEHLLVHLKQKIKRYTAFEPNSLFATKLRARLSANSENGAPLPCLDSGPEIYGFPFSLETDTEREARRATSNDEERYSLVLFCHSMYGMTPKYDFINQALEKVVDRPRPGFVVVFHRHKDLQVADLVCQNAAIFPAGLVRIINDDNVLDNFASFIAGFAIEKGHESLTQEWRNACRTLGRHDKSSPGHLLFSSANAMAVFNRHATTLPDLLAQVPSVKEQTRIKNRDAWLHNPASIVRPTDVQQIQKCVQWALKNEVSLVVIGGSHSDHCLWPSVVSIDMSAFDQIHVMSTARSREGSRSYDDSMVVVEAGCKTGDIIRKTMAVGLTVPLGSRPSVGAGLWLQGGIGHLARLHGLACDAVVGAVIVGVTSGQILCVGNVPIQHRPRGSVVPENASDILWAIRGAGTNFGIVTSITFKAYAAPTYLIRNWVLPLSNAHEATLILNDFDERVAKTLPRHCSADAFLYCEAGQLRLGVTKIESSTTKLTFAVPTSVGQFTGLEEELKTVDSTGLFEAGMYVSGMHGGHANGKTSSFKRCLFLKGIGNIEIAKSLVAAIEIRPLPLSYIHLLQGGGAIRDVAADATAMGCRDWDFACVITGVWPRDQDDTEIARSAVQWVYDVAEKLLPVCSGVYGADLGPDPRDRSLAAKAFGPNGPRLARLKKALDPHSVLAYSCPLPEAPKQQKLIILVTGRSGAGKDYCADQWVSIFTRSPQKNLKVRALSISETTKQAYASAVGADFKRLVRDRAYKEQHRPALTKFFQMQEQQQPEIAEEHFMDLVNASMDADVIFISGMRDEAPVVTLSHLVSDSKLLEVYVQASEKTRQLRRGHASDDCETDTKTSSSSSMTLDSCPNLIFKNDATGKEAALKFAERYLLPLLDEKLQQLAAMIRQVPGFPYPDIEFRHILGIAQQPGGLAMSTSLLQAHFTGSWSKIDAVVSCEAGGFVFAAALAARVDLPLVLIRQAGKLPPPTVSVCKPESYISSSGLKTPEEKRIEMERDVLPRGASVVVVDDVLSTGQTLCAVIQLLAEVGINAEDVSVMTLAEFPIHRGRDCLRRNGFGMTNIQSLLVFSGA